MSMTMPSEFAPLRVSVQGRSVAYADLTPAAPGLPLVLLHGAGFDHAGLSWGRAGPLLADERRVIIPDLPGYGGSDGFEGSYDLADLGRWLIAFLDALGLDRVDLCGVSMGGGLALWTALEVPARVAHVVPVCSYGIMRRAPLHSVGWLAARRPISTWIYRGAASRRVLRRLGLPLAFADSSAAEPELLRALQAVARDQIKRRSFDAFLQQEMRLTGLKSCLTRRLGELPMPVLFVHGRRDPVVPVRHARRAVRAVPGAQLCELESGHWPMRELPGPFAEIVSAFLNTGDPTPRRAD